VYSLLLLEVKFNDFKQEHCIFGRLKYVHVHIYTRLDSSIVIPCTVVCKGRIYKIVLMQKAEIHALPL